MKISSSLAALALAAFMTSPALAAGATKEAVEEIGSNEQQAEIAVDAEPADESRSAAEEPTPNVDETAKPEKEKKVCRYVKSSTSRLGTRVCSPAGGK